MPHVPVIVERNTSDVAESESQNYVILGALRGLAGKYASRRAAKDATGNAFFLLALFSTLREQQNEVEDLTSPLLAS